VLQDLVLCVSCAVPLAVAAVVLQPRAHHPGRGWLLGGSFHSSQLLPVLLRTAGEHAPWHVAMMCGRQQSMSQQQQVSACSAAMPACLCTAVVMQFLQISVGPVA
jgi:hypothetical protein